MLANLTDRNSRLLATLISLAWIQLNGIELANAQGDTGESDKLDYRAGLVLTDSLCVIARDKTSWNRRAREVVQERLCSSLESVVNNTFDNYIVLTDTQNAADAGVDIVLTPRWLGGTTGIGSRGYREILIIVEWTLTRQDSAILWVKPVQGFAYGNPRDKDNIVRDFDAVFSDLSQNSESTLRTWARFR